MLFDGHANPVPDMEARVEHEARTTPDGGAEFDAPDLVEASAGACIDELLKKAGQLASRIAAVGSATLVGNIIGVDASAQAITPVYTWADTRSAPFAAVLRAEMNEREVHNRTGCLTAEQLPTCPISLASAHPCRTCLRRSSGG